MRTTGANGRQSSLSPVFLAAAGSLAHVNANGPLSAAPPPGRCANHDAPGKTRFQLRAVRRVAKAGNAASFFEFAPPPPGGASIGARSEKRSQLKAWAEATARSTQTTGAKRWPHPPRASTLPGREIPAPLQRARPCHLTATTTQTRTAGDGREGKDVRLAGPPRARAAHGSARSGSYEPGPARTLSRRRQPNRPGPAPTQTTPRRLTRLSHSPRPAGKARRLTGPRPPAKSTRPRCRPRRGAAALPGLRIDTTTAPPARHVAGSRAAVPAATSSQGHRPPPTHRPTALTCLDPCKRTAVQQRHQVTAQAADRPSRPH